VIDDGEGARGVGQIVRAVRKRSGAGRADLKKAKEVFGLVGEGPSMGVHSAHASSVLGARLAFLQLVDVDAGAMQKDLGHLVASNDVKVARQNPRAFDLGGSVFELGKTSWLFRFLVSRRGGRRDGFRIQLLGLLEGDIVDVL
jgi:hypothetical protein